MPSSFVVKAQQEYGQHVKRADTNELREVFDKYAKIEKDGEKYMSPLDFVVDYLGDGNRANLNIETAKLMGSILDTTRDGLISFVEFQAFEALLCQPDSIYKAAFHLFDKNSSGHVTYDEFETIIRLTDLHEKIPFDFKGEFMNLHFGVNRKRTVTYQEFTQLLHDFHEEHAIQAFKKYDTKKSGTISALNFADIMTSTKSHLLSEHVKQNLVSVTSAISENQVTFPYFMAFNTLLNNMELIKRIYLNFTKGNFATEVTKEEFLYAAQQMSQITPLEINILFDLADLLHADGRISLHDIEKIAPFRPVRYLAKPFAEMKAVNSPEERSVAVQFLESSYRFGLGSIAGATGATFVYPIDLVKTRMQNQRTGSLIGELMYRNSLDCFKKVIRHEGFKGLYRGLLPQLVGVCPEKAIKLTMNDLVRDKLMTESGDITLASEVLAGATAGASQVMFTNPLEIVKIRLQVAGEITTGPKVSAVSVIKELGLRGLYKGAKACFLRDIPFSAIYFPVYAHCKLRSADPETGVNSLPSLLTSALIAGIPAAYLVTPADVIKTRLQVAARKGQSTYSGVLDAARKINHEEGFAALFKGGPARIFRSAPQFAVTLFTYECLQRIFVVDFGGRRPAGSEVVGGLSVEDQQSILSKNPDHVGGYKLAQSVFSGMQQKFGLSFPMYQKASN